MPEYDRYEKVYVDLYVTDFGGNVISTIELDDVEYPLENDEVTQAICKIYSDMNKANGRPFKFIRVTGVPDNEDDEDEEELICVYQKDLSRDYGIEILEYTSVWTGNRVCV
jgi:hypothetical protein